MRTSTSVRIVLMISRRLVTLIHVGNHNAQCDSQTHRKYMVPEMFLSWAGVVFCE